MLENKVQKKGGIERKGTRIKKDGAGDCSAKTGDGRREKTAPPNGDGREPVFRV